MADLRSERTVSHFLIIKTHHLAGRFKAIGVLKKKEVNRVYFDLSVLH